MSEFTAQDFLVTAPERPIGCETEYTVNAGGWRPTEIFHNPYYVEDGGVTQPTFPPLSPSVNLNPRVWWANGARTSNESSVFEWSTPLAIGPLEATAADFAGMNVLARIFDAFIAHETELNRKPVPGLALYRTAGTTFKGEGKDTPTTITVGPHDNLLSPRSILLEAPGLLRGVVGTYLATRNWAWGGTVGPSGFELSQKASGIGEQVYIGNPYPSRSREGNKPLAWCKTSASDQSVLGEDSDWMRVELRCVDPGLSRRTRFVALASASLVLRLLEHRQKIDIKRLRDCLVPDPVVTLRQVSQDLTLKRELATLDGRTMTATNIHEEFIALSYALSQEVRLTDQELKGLELWEDTNTRMARSDFTDDFSAAEPVVDAAAKLHYVQKHVPNLAEVHAHNPEAARRGIIFDRISREGPGLTYQERVRERYPHLDPIGDERIEDRMFHAPPGTSAAVREEVIRHAEQHGGLIVVRWPFIRFSSGEIWHLGPYNITLRQSPASNR